MKISVHITRVATSIEIDVSIDRGPSRRDHERWAIEASEKWRATAEAMRAAPEEADQIIEHALEES